MRQLALRRSVSTTNPSTAHRALNLSNLDEGAKARLRRSLRTRAQQTRAELVTARQARFQTRMGSGTVHEGGTATAQRAGRFANLPWVVAPLPLAACGNVTGSPALDTLIGANIMALPCFYMALFMIYNDWITDRDRLKTVISKLPLDKQVSERITQIILDADKYLSWIPNIPAQLPVIFLALLSGKFYAISNPYPSYDNLLETLIIAISFISHYLFATALDRFFNSVDK